MFTVVTSLLRQSSAKTTTSKLVKWYSNGAIKNVGVIGAGNVGRAVCVGLLRNGHNVKVFDPVSTNAAFLQEKGAKWAKGEVDVAENADVLITAVPAPQHVRHVMEEVGLIHKLPEGSCWIDHTTTDKNETIRLAKIAESRNVKMLEAPLTGGLELLKAGHMTVLIGGDKETLEQYKPVVQSYTDTMVHMGPIGNASMLKVISNMLAGAYIVISSEAVMLAKRQGIDLRLFFDGIRASAGNSYVFETEVPLMFNGKYDPGFRIALHNKDWRLGRQLCDEARVPMEVMGLVDQIYKRAQYRYGDDAGSAAPGKLIEDDLHESIRVEGFENWGYSLEKVTGGGIAVVHKFDKEPES